MLIFTNVDSETQERAWDLRAEHQYLCRPQPPPEDLQIALITNYMASRAFRFWLSSMVDFVVFAEAGGLDERRDGG